MHRAGLHSGAEADRSGTVTFSLKTSVDNLGGEEEKTGIVEINRLSEYLLL